MENRRARETPPSYKAGIFLGITMVVCAIIMLITRFASLEIDGETISVEDGPLGILSRFMLLLGGAIILLKRKKGNYFAVGMYALTLGLSRLVRSIPYLGAESDIVFYSGVFIVILSGNLAITGYNHLTIRMRDPLNMRITTLIILLFYAVVLMYFIYIDEKPVVILRFMPDVVWYIPIYVMLLIVLFSKEVVDNSPLGRIRTHVSETADRFGLGEEITISEEDAEKIKAGIAGPQGWKAKVIGGVEILEENVTFESRRGDRDVVLERCEGDGTLRITVVDDREDSFINGRRLSVSSYNESHGSLDLIDGRGVCAKLNVRRSPQ